MPGSVALGRGQAGGHARRAVDRVVGVGGEHVHEALAQRVDAEPARGLAELAGQRAGRDLHERAVGDQPREAPGRAMERAPSAPGGRAGSASRGAGGRRPAARDRRRDRRERALDEQVRAAAERQLAQRLVVEARRAATARARRPRRPRARCRASPSASRTAARRCREDARIGREHVADVRGRGHHARARVHGRARQLDGLLERSAGPSSTPGRMWACRSITRVQPRAGGLRVSVGHDRRGGRGTAAMIAPAG